MPQRTVIAKNVTGSPVSLARLGVTIGPAQQRTLSDFFRLDELQEDEELPTLVTAGTIVLNDGTDDLSPTAAVNLITPPISDKDLDAEMDAATADLSGSGGPGSLVRLDGSGLLPIRHIRESGGPTFLSIGSIPDNGVLKRTGSSVVGVVGGSGISGDDHKTLLQLIHFIDQGPAEGFTTGATKTITYSGAFPTTVLWKRSDNTKLVEKTTTYSGAFPSSVVWKVYDTDGSTVLSTVTDTISYSGAFESSRSRAIS